MKNMVDNVKSVIGERKTNYPQYKEITAPSGYINVDNPITVGEFIGKKVVMIDIMTYSCINCQRTFPYINAWHEKYKDEGLQIIGIHTPEFAFEKDIDNLNAWLGLL